MQNLRMSRSGAFFHFVGWYTTCLKESHDIGCNIGENCEYEEIDSCEELMLRYTMNLMHWKRWDGKSGLNKRRDFTVKAMDGKIRELDHTLKAYTKTRRIKIINFYIFRTNTLTLCPAYFLPTATLPWLVTTGCLPLYSPLSILTGSHRLMSRQ